MKYAVIAGLLMFSAQASSAQMLDAPSGALHTTVTGRNVADVTQDVQGWHDMQHSACKFSKVVSADVVTQDAQGVTENWTIEACKGQRFTYRVFIIHSHGAITDAVSNADGSPFKRG